MEDVMKNVADAIVLMDALKDAQQIADSQIDLDFDKLRASSACSDEFERLIRHISDGKKVSEIIHALIDKHPVTGGNIYSRLMNIV